MINNYWEELDMKPDVLSFHEKSLARYNFPDWLKMSCPYCKEKFELRSIREIGLRLNTRNMGDIAVEFCCDKCNRMNTLYYRENINTFEEFFDIISGKKPPKSEPMLEENMYKSGYNNVVQEMLGEKDMSMIKRANFKTTFSVINRLVICDKCGFSREASEEKEYTTLINSICPSCQKGTLKSKINNCEKCNACKK